MLLRFCGDLPPTILLFQPIENQMLFNKPDGGLWCAPVSKEGVSPWETFCRAARLDPPEGRFDFQSALEQVYVIDSVQDYLDLVASFPTIDPWNQLSLDFEAMVASRRYRGIYLTENGALRCHWARGGGPDRGAYASLREWEIESILWLYWPQELDGVYQL